MKREHRLNTAGTVSSPKAGRPVAANMIVTAQLNTSEAGPTASPVSCSGDMYGGVPTIFPDVIVT